MAHRIGESAVIAVATAIGVCLVGTVPTDADHGRMSIDAAALDVSQKAVFETALSPLPDYPIPLPIAFLPGPKQEGA